MYGLYRALTKLGHEVRAVDYVSEGNPRPSSAKQKIADVLNRRYNKIKAERYADFRNKLFKNGMTKPLKKAELPSVCDDFDIFVAGSDQIWHNHISFMDGFDFPDLVEKPDKKYTYAVSFNMKGVPSDKTDEYTRRLSSFQRFSVREAEGVEAVKTLTGRDADVHIDPSLLLNTRDWLDCIKDIEVPKQKYIAVYTVGKPVKLIEYAKQLAKQKGCRLLYLSDFFGHMDVKHVRGLGPLEFLAYIANAEYVFTNSFHGTAFSINFHKQFFTELQTAVRYNSRSESLMKKCGLFERDLTANSSALSLADKAVDWDSVEAALDAERKRSTEYFNQIVSEVSEN